MKAFLTITALCIPLMIVSALWRGYVLTCLWAWFIVTTFGAVPLKLPAAIGVSIVVSFLTHQFNPDQKDDQETMGKIVGATVHALLFPLIALIVGAIVREWL